MKKKNYLDYIPVRNEKNSWSILEDDIVSIEVVNTGFFYKIAQTFFKTPKKSEIKLDKYGSIVWKCIDDKKDIGEIANEVRSNFEDEDKMFYERLVKFFHILKENKFVKFKEK